MFQYKHYKNCWHFLWYVLRYFVLKFLMQMRYRFIVDSLPWHNHNMSMSDLFIRILWAVSKHAAVVMLVLSLPLYPGLVSISLPHAFRVSVFMFFRCGKIVKIITTKASLSLTTIIFCTLIIPSCIWNWNLD